MGTKNRQGYIGSSDIASVLGVSRFKTQLMLWAEKTGEIEAPDLSDKEFVEWGTRLEAVVAEKFAEKNNVKLMAYKKRFVNKQYPFLTCELDRIIVGTDEIVEVKTTNAWNYKAWENEDIPLDYIYQVQFALGITGRKKGYFAVLIGGNKYIERVIEFNQELYDMMIEKAVHFWENNILNHIPPMAVSEDNNTIVNLYPSELSEELIIANNAIEEAIALRQELDMHIKELASQKDDVEAKIKQIIGTNRGITTQKYLVTWEEQTRTTLDTAQLKADGLYDNYSKQSKSRYFRVRKTK